MAKNTAVAKVIEEPTALVASAESEQAANQEVLASDVLIPRLLLMQGLSPLVTARKAQLGDIVRSTTAEKLGDPEKPVDIVPIKIANSWTLFEVVGNKPEFRSQEPRNAANEGLEWDFVKNGMPWQRRKTITLFALVPADVASYEAEIKRAADAGEVPDLNKTVLPVVITFQSTSFKWAGKKASTFFNTIRVNARRVPGLTPYDYVLPLICKEEKNEKGTFFVYDLGISKPLRDKAIRATAESWSVALSSGPIKTDDTGEVADTAEPTDVSNEV